MSKSKGNKEYNELKYDIKRLNKEINTLEQKKKQLVKKSKMFVKCEKCNKHFRKQIEYLDTTFRIDEPYYWICPYCNNRTNSHEFTTDKYFWSR